MSKPYSLAHAKTPPYLTNSYYLRRTPQCTPTATTGHCLVVTVVLQREVTTTAAVGSAQPTKRPCISTFKGLVTQVSKSGTLFSDVTVGTPCQIAMVVMIIGQWVKAGPHLSKAMHLELVFAAMANFVFSHIDDPAMVTGIGSIDGKSYMVTLEMGGKDPFIVCEDVDVPHVAQVAARAAVQSSGHNCVGGGRFYVHKDIYPAFVAAVVKIVKYVTSVSPPQSGKYDMGAICLQDHSETLQILINDALDKGAEIVAGGSVTDISEGVVDQYFPATIIVIVDPR
ncbi:aldehyde dehydrogenase 22A1 [Tanacetum coccineum]